MTVSVDDNDICMLRYAHEPHHGCSGRGMNAYLTFPLRDDVSEIFYRWMEAWHKGEAPFREAGRVG